MQRNSRKVVDHGFCRALVCYGFVGILRGACYGCNAGNTALCHITGHDAVGVSACGNGCLSGIQRGFCQTDRAEQCIGQHDIFNDLVSRVGDTVGILQNFAFVCSDFIDKCFNVNTQHHFAGYQFGIGTADNGPCRRDGSCRGDVVDISPVFVFGGGNVLIGNGCGLSRRKGGCGQPRIGKDAVGKHKFIQRGIAAVLQRNGIGNGIIGTKRHDIGGFNHRQPRRRVNGNAACIVASHHGKGGTGSDGLYLTCDFASPHVHRCNGVSVQGSGLGLLTGQQRGFKNR